MSVQCKNCVHCYLELKTCSLHYHKRYRKPLKVNLTKQRMCAEFIRRKQSS